MKKMNNKGFSLIELIIVIAIMAILIAIIAPNLTKYLGSSKKNTDKKNADELCSQIQTAITDYESTSSSYLLDSTVGTKLSIAWNSSSNQATSTRSNGSSVVSTVTAFDSILNKAITSPTTSKEKGTTATAVVDMINSADASDGYKVTVVVGDQSVTK